MSLRTTFEQLTEMVFDECATSSATSRNNDNRAYVQRLLKRHYEFLCDEHDWGFLHVTNDDATKELQAGERFYDYPVGMGLNNTMRADTFYGNVWVPLTYGIDMENYTSMNPETDQRADPQTNWRIYTDRQFEVWPMPASNGNLVRFTGKKLPEALVGDTSRADMDDHLLVLYVAAEVTAKKDSKDSALKLAAAQRRLGQLKMMYTARLRVRMGMGSNPEDQRGFPRIRAFPASN